MPDYHPKFTPGQAFTLIASADVVGGRIVTGAGAPASAGSTTWLGVASRDAGPGQPFGVFTDAVQRPVAAGPIAANTLVRCAEGGKVTPYVESTDSPEQLVGLALESATADGDVLAVKLTR